MSAIEVVDDDAAIFNGGHYTFFGNAKLLLRSLVEDRDYARGGCFGFNGFIALAAARMQGEQAGYREEKRPALQGKLWAKALV